METILDFDIGLTLGILNEQSNQALEYRRRNKKNKDENDEQIVQGDAKMLMNM